MFSEVIELLEIDSEKTSTGGRKSIIKSSSEVFANRKSVRANEFYQAYQSGLQTTALFEMWTDEYNDERIIKHNDKYYTVIRSYVKSDFIELTCIKRNGLFEESTR